MNERPIPRYIGWSLAFFLGAVMWLVIAHLLLAVWRLA